VINISRLGDSLRKRINKSGFWYLLLAPACVFLLIFMAYPLMATSVISLFSWDGLKPMKFVGLDNFVRILEDDVFWKSVWHTIAYSIIVPGVDVGLGLVLAYTVSRRVKGWRIFRFGYYIPAMLSVTVVAKLWVYLYEPNLGAINELLRRIGLEALTQIWLSDVHISLLSVMIVPIWQYLGFPFIVLLAGIEGVPQDLHDAATVDGAGEWERFRFITIPLIKPVLASVAMLQLIFSMKVFDVIWVMTRGGPADSTSVLATYMYRQAFSRSAFGIASAIAVVMFGTIFTITYVYQRFTRLEEIEF
jgi:raffinose/stachyose/melibiose transport system permease protein